MIGHSQGGVVARTMLAFEYDRKGVRPPPISNVVTLASPHQGADLATGVAMLQHTDVGSEVVKAVDGTGVLPFDITGESVKQLSEVSWFMQELHDRPLPENVRFTSIGSRGDVYVPGARTHVDGAKNTIVSVGGVLGEHGNLPGSPEGRREVALALAGLNPTCQTLATCWPTRWCPTGSPLSKTLRWRAVFRRRLARQPGE